MGRPPRQTRNTNPCKEIFLDIDDIKTIWEPVHDMQPGLRLHLTDSGANRLRSITQPAVSKGQRLVVLLDGEVVAAPVRDNVLTDLVSVENPNPAQTKRIQPHMPQVTHDRGKESADSRGSGANE